MPQPVNARSLQFPFLPDARSHTTVRAITEFLKVVRYKEARPGVAGGSSLDHSTSAYQAGLSAATPGSLFCIGAGE